MRYGQAGRARALEYSQSCRCSPLPVAPYWQRESRNELADWSRSTGEVRFEGICLVPWRARIYGSGTLLMPVS